MAATLLSLRSSDTSFGGSQNKLLTNMTSPSVTVSEQQHNTNRVSIVSPPISAPVSHGFTTTPQTNNDWGQPLTQKSNNPIRPNVSALDALATLATSTITSSSPANNNNNNTTDFESMPPPPPRRMRSASNPEGMEKWDSYRTSSRCHFVLPTSILEEELASAHVACQAHDEEMARNHRNNTQLLEDADQAGGPMTTRGLTVFRVNSHLLDEPQQQQTQQQKEGASPITVRSSSPPEGSDDIEAATTISTASSSSDSLEEDVNDLEPEELLRRARSRLLEDLACETNVQKAVLPLPHALEKYKSLYNKNGRIGIYTPLERAAIIAKFNSKRGRRVWNKKIRYNCRKNLADRRMRVKGRFVKRAVEQQKKKPVVKKLAGGRNKRTTATTSTTVPIQETEETTSCGGEDVDMPDVNDPDAEFVPTSSQPYRRVRRHTIT